MSGARLFQRWTAQEDAELRERAARHEAIPSIAAAMQRGLGSIRNRLKDLGLCTLAWTEAEDDRLREAWGVVPGRQLAAELHRTYQATKLRAIKLKLDAGYRFTAEQVAMIRDLYPTHSAKQIAERLPGRRRHPQSISKHAAELGLRKKPPEYPLATLAAVGGLHAEGLPDFAVATRLGLSFDQARYIRRERLELPCNPDTERGRRSVASQLKTLGLERPCDLRNRAFKAYVAESIWPAEWELRVREVQILNVLAERGPMSALEIAKAIGANTASTHKTGSKRTLLADNGRDGTYTASLRNKGLIVYVFVGGGHKRKPGLFQLGAEPIKHLEERSHASNSERHSA